MNNAKRRTRCRRDFLKFVGLGATSLIISRSSRAEDQGRKTGETRHPTRNILLSNTGGDRGTAYVMSNKIARPDGRLICTWIDSDRQNRWALVDPKSGEVLRVGTVGEPRRDNHCGAAMATDIDGTLHLIIGGHHAPFVHYRMPTGSDQWQIVCFRIQHCGQLSRHRDGTIEVVLMVAPEPERGWGSKGTELVRVLVDPNGSVRHAELVRPCDTDMPHWLPSIERWCWHAPIAKPALLYTRGINAGGYQHNRNCINTEVWLQIS